MDPQLKDLARTLASLTDSEYQTVTAEARRETDALVNGNKQTAADALAQFLRKGNLASDNQSTAGVLDALKEKGVVRDDG
jgi:hypothetical protein